jgi:hypothetical protein
MFAVELIAYLAGFRIAGNHSDNNPFFEDGVGIFQPLCIELAATSTGIAGHQEAHDHGRAPCCARNF